MWHSLRPDGQEKVCILKFLKYISFFVTNPYTKTSVKVKGGESV